MKLVMLLGVVLWVVMWGGASGGARELTLTLPPGWIPTQPLSPEQKLHALLLDEQNMVQAELIFAVAPMPGNLDLAGYLNALGQSLQQVFASYTPQKTTPFEVNGLSGLRHDFLFRVSGNPSDLRGLAFFFSLEGQVYTLSFHCLASAFPGLEDQFVRIAQGLAATSEAPGALPPSSGLSPGGGEGALVWMYQDAQRTIKVPLPQGTAMSQELENGAVYVAPNEGQIVILKLDSEAALQGILAQVVQGKNLHGTGELHTAAGRSIQVTLYSSVNPETGIQYATLLGVFPGETLLVLVVLPASQYVQAQNWIAAMLQQVEIR